MSDPIPLQTPGGFAPVVALGLDDGSGNLAVINAARPIPVQNVPQSAPAALAGSSSANIVVGPFTPETSGPVFCTLDGDFSGTVQVMRSVDDGATLYPLTAGGSRWALFSAPACEPVWEESEAGASLWLDCKIATGTLSYRLSQ